MKVGKAPDVREVCFTFFFFFYACYDGGAPLFFFLIPPLNLGAEKKQKLLRTYRMKSPMAY